MNTGWKRWSVTGLLALGACSLIACGGGTAAEPEPEPTQGAEVEAEAPPPPPPAPARVRVIHASPEAAAATVSIALDGAAEPAITDLAYRSGSALAEVPPGAHTLAVRGIPSVETGEAPELVSASTPELYSDVRYTAFAFGLAGAEPPLALTIVEDRTEPLPAEGTAAVRFFHALIGVEAVDVCAAGPTPRDPAVPVFAGAAPGLLASGEAGAYVEIAALGEVALQLRAPNATPCRGRVLGVARFTPTAGAIHTLVAVGRTTGRPRADRELVVCVDAPAEPSCSTVAIAAR